MLDSRIHHATPEGRDEAQKDGLGVPAWQLRRARQRDQTLVGLAWPAVMVTVAAHVEERPIVHAAP
jgi:hypothetical protein